MKKEAESLDPRLATLQGEAARSARSGTLNRLGAALAHQIRNPLATIFSALSQIKKHGQVKGDTATLVNIALEEAARLNQMITGLLDFTKPGAPSFVEGRPHQVARSFVANSSENGKIPANIEVELVPNHEELVGFFDPDRLLLVLHHLLRNALEAIGSHPGKVRIEIGPAGGTDPGWVLKIEDNGPGISATELDLVFDPFYSSKAANTGLGLSIIKQIANEHKGEAIVESDNQSGTRVTVRFNASPKNELIK